MASRITLPRRPKVKREGLVVEAAGGEVLIYNRKNDHVHSLNDPAARVWNLCTGRRTVEQIASELDVALDPAARAIVVRDAIAQFERAGLLDAVDGALASPSRRTWARRIGIGVATGFAMPLVTSILAPSAYAASSCVPKHGRCSATKRCCPGLHCAGTSGMCA